MFPCTRPRPYAQYTLQYSDVTSLNLSSTCQDKAEKSATGTPSKSALTAPASSEHAPIYLQDPPRGQYPPRGQAPVPLQNKPLDILIRVICM